MSNCTSCNDSILNPQPVAAPFCIECAEADNKCIQKFPAECVIYHINDDIPSKLPNINIPNKTSVSTILEAIDALIANNFNIPIISSNTKTINLTTSGPSHHNISANLNLSPSLGNLLQVKDDGLFVGTGDLGKVKVEEGDTLAYLSEQVIGDTDGIVSISTPVSEGLLKITPSLDIENLITDIRNNHLDSFNNLLSVSSNSNNTSSVINIQTRLAPFVAYPFHGSMTNFDDNGVGKAENGYGKIYVCNGLNGTPDYRGRSPMGANIGVPGGSLGASVNPSNPEAISLSINQLSGSHKEKLTSAQVGEHSHSINDQGHNHFTVANAGDTGYINLYPNRSIAWTSEHHNGNQDYDLVSNSAVPTLGPTSNSDTNITINNNDGGEYHNNTHPVVGAVFIMYIP